MKLIFATNNSNKIKEVKKLLNPSIELLSLKDISCTEELPETQKTLEGNALQKARYIYENYHKNCFADDTGLVVGALNGEPGVYSARYAGEEKDAKANMAKVLSKLEGETNREAYFETVIALIIEGEEYTFKGRVNGEIIERETGQEGFGYDPIFKPVGKAKTFAEMSLEEKNKISHRGIALSKMIVFINEVV